MKWLEAKVIFDCPDTQLAADLISDLFYQQKVQGVIVEDPDVEPEEGWGEGPVVRPEQHAVIGFFPDRDSMPARCRQLEMGLDHLRDKNGIKSRVAYRSIDEEDWAESWKAFFWPEKIGRHLVVKPTWREYDAQPEDRVVEIDPGMAFGTGTHPTTRLCVQMMETHLRPGDRFLDVGTGSGILLVAAAKLGAGRMCGIDTDEIAVQIAGDNVRINGIDNDRVDLRPGTTDVIRSQRFDLIVANILSEVIVELLDDIPRLLKPKGIFICSGIIEKSREQVRSKMVRCGFKVVGERLLESWAAIAGELRTPRRKPQAPS